MTINEGKKRSVFQLTSRHSITDNRIFNLMAETLAEAGYDSAVVGPHDSSSISEGVRLIAIPRTQKRLARLVRLMAPWKLLFFSLRSRECNTFAIHDPDMLKIGFLLKVFGNVVLYDIHDDYEASVKSRLLRFGRVFASIGAKIWWIYERSLTQIFDGVIVADRHLAKKFSEKRPVILGNFPTLDFTKQADTSRESTFNLIYVGEANRDRGALQFLKALRLLPHSDIRCHIVGNCFDEEVKSLMSQDERVCFHGRMPWKDLSGFYERSHLGLAIYQPIPAFTYCTGENAVKIQEYMAAGIAILTSNFQGLIEYVEVARTGLTVQPDSPTAIAEKIDLLYKDRKLLRELGGNGRLAFEERYNWDMHKYKLVDLYDEKFQ